MTNNLHEGHRQRVRQRYIDSGLDNFEDHQILELLLFYCYPRKDTNEIAHKMLEEFGSLHALLEADPIQISKRCNVSINIAVLVSLIPPISRRYFYSKIEKVKAIKSSQMAGEIAISLFIGKTIESLFILCLDKHQKLIKAECVTKGNASQAPIYPEEIVKAALKYNTNYVILTHNHPGGALEPSSEDIEATKKIMKALKAVGISVLDHIIVADNKFYSLTEKKIMPSII